MHTLFNVIRLSLSPGIMEVYELDYLTQITFELYERSRGLGVCDGSPMEYSLRIGFSVGAHDSGLIDTQMDSGHALSVAPRKYVLVFVGERKELIYLHRWITDHIELDEALKRLLPKLQTPRTSPYCSPKLQLRSTLSKLNL